MALYHNATITPTKQEVIAAWLPSRPWAPDGDDAAEIVAAYRFDDPEGRVGLEAHLVRHGDAVLHVPLTYRDEPLDGMDDHLVATMQHSALGQRWVYDGVHDPVFTRMFVAAALTGCGQTIGIVRTGDRWLVVPPNIRLVGGGYSGERTPVDGFVVDREDRGWTALRSDHFDILVARSVQPGEQPRIGIRATWAGQELPVVLADVRGRSAAEQT